MLQMIMANDWQPVTSYMCNSNHSFLCLCYGDNDDYNDDNYSRSRPFWLLPVVKGPLWPVGSTSSMAILINVL